MTDIELRLQKIEQNQALHNADDINWHRSIEVAIKDASSTILQKIEENRLARDDDRLVRDDDRAQAKEEQAKFKQELQPMLDAYKTARMSGIWLAAGVAFLAAIIGIYKTLLK